jgi:DNA mismatch repair protein PMS2
VIFSTKANSNTRENIANIFGAKTLQSLVPLDLKFELNPSTLPSQSARKWSTQNETVSKEVQLIGHISRPVVGEGRQTADRQMFFVNSRPCALPQVAKAINEVYRSYNLTQSPYIFANLKLDTNAYDVNVSPDKRTILLHDQTTLLEALKNSLTELFEAHEQSVPQAQLSARKLPTYKALTITRQSPVNVDEDEAGEDSSPALNPPPASIMRKFVARQTITRDEAEKRSNRESANSRLQSIESNLTKENNGSSEDKDHPKDTPLPTTLVSISTPVRDFNKRLGVELGSKVSHHNMDDSPISGQGDPVDFDHNSNEKPSTDDDGHASVKVDSEDDVLQSKRGNEESIPSVSQNSKIPDNGLLPNAFERLRRPRPNEDTATITIGDVTTITTLGTPPSKRQRTDISKQKAKGVITPTNPILLKSLRSFAAPGSQLHDVQMDDVDMVTLQSEQENGAADDVAIPRLRQFPSSVTIPLSEFRAAGEDKSESSEDKPGDGPVDDDESDGEYVDEAEKKAREEVKVARMIAEAEEAAARPTDENIKRATSVLKARSRRDATLQILKKVDASTSAIEDTLNSLQSQLARLEKANSRANRPSQNDKDENSVEERLALSVSKADFGHMKVLGQFNLGFILAMRPSHPAARVSRAIDHDKDSDELFIIDQHASDEKYNFERLQAETVVQNQRLVHPKTLDLTAVEEELILNHPEALSKNGFIVSTDQSGDKPVGRRCQLISLPMSKEVIFDSQDLEELLTLLSDQAGSKLPRPSKVRRMFAMRACRSSIMVGKTLTAKQMQRVVRHMGEIDKPWNCPHGRPTMRHLYGLGSWKSWNEGSGVAGLGEKLTSNTDWNEYLRQARVEMDSAAESKDVEDDEE